MVRKVAGKPQGGSQGRPKEKSKGPSSDSQAHALRIRSMDELLGIELLDFLLGVGDILAPRASIHALKQQFEIRHTPSMSGYNRFTRVQARIQIVLFMEMKVGI